MSALKATYATDPNTRRVIAETFLQKYVSACADHDMELARYWRKQYDTYRPISNHETLCLNTPTVHSHIA